MIGKEVFDSKYFYSMLAFICLVIIGLLAWNIWIPLIVVLPIAIIIPLLITLGAYFKHWQGFIGEWKNLTYSTIYAITTTMVVFVVISNLGFIILKDFYNTLLLTTIFIFILVAVFVYSVIYFKKKLVKAPFISRQVVVDMVVVSIIICLVWSSVFLILVGGGLYDKYVVRTEESMKQINDDMQNYKLTADEKGLIVFNELGAYYDVNVIQSNKAIEDIKKKEKAKPIIASCLVDDCFEFVAERVLINYDYAITSLIFKEQMNNAREIAIELKENELHGNKDKSKYFELLGKGINNEYFIEDVDEFDVLLLKLENDFNYDEMQEINKKMEDMFANLGGMGDVAGLLSAKSLLMKSFNNVFLHTNFAEQMFVVIAKIGLNSNKNTKLNPLLDKVYTNKDVEETSNGKIIRNYLFYKHTEKRDDLDK